MDILERFIRDIAYKFPKGYPDMKDPKDVELLNELLNEATLQPKKSEINEGPKEEEYNKVIRRALGLKDDEEIFSNINGKHIKMLNKCF